MVRFLLSNLFLFIAVLSSTAEFGKAPQKWGDFKIGLVSDGDSISTYRLRGATEDLGIKLSYRYRYINEGVDPAKNACQWVFPKPGNGTNYSEKSMELTGTEASYVIYMLQEEGGTTKLKNNINDPEKMRNFFHTLRIVADNANGHGATIIVEPDTWGYLLQDKYGTVVKDELEDDPTKIPAQINNLRDSIYYDTIITPDWQTGNHDTVIKEIDLDFSYLSDLPNNLAGVGRAIIRTMHKYAPDCYVGFLASHWSVNLNPWWSTDGLVWSDPELRDTSAKINIEFFKKLYWGSIDADHPKQPGDDPDFIGMEKNGWCAGRWEATKGFTYWFWGDQEMKNYLEWVKQIAEGLNLPVVGWQISIGNMDNQNVFNKEQMANSYQDTYFPYFFTHIDEFLDAGFIGFLVGKGLSEATDYTLPSENIGEKGWFFNELIEFDKSRPYLDTSISDVSISKQNHKIRPNIIATQKDINIIAPDNNLMSVAIVDMKGREIHRRDVRGNMVLSKKLFSSGVYFIHIKSSHKTYYHKVLVRR